MKHIDFNKIKNSSKVLLDFLADAPPVKSRFPRSEQSNDLEYFSNFAQSFGNRQQAFDVINKSMIKIIKSNKQVQNIDNSRNDNTLFVITGQQAGLFGGPLYSANKIATAISNAKKLSKKYPSLNFVPLFWLEDNDHDSREAGEVNIFDTSGDNHKISIYSAENDNKPISELILEDSIDEIITATLDLLPYSQYKNEVGALVEAIYHPGVSWGDATLLLYQQLFAASGLLFVKASECRKNGLFAPLLAKNFQSPEKAAELSQAIAKGIEASEKLGYTNSFKSESLSYCLHTDSMRYVLRSSDDGKFQAGGTEYSFDELQELADSQASKFSPKVLLRPIFQDSIFPNALSILGPGEIAYYSIIKEAYEFFGIDMPAIKMRMSATLLTAKQVEILEANDLQFEFFLRDISEIEADLSRVHTDEYTEEQFEKSGQMITAAFENMKPIVSKTDPSLERTADSSLHKCLDLLETLKKKNISAQKKKNFDMTQKYRKLKNFIYLNNKLQERNYSPINFMNYYGIEKFANILLELADKEIKEHIIYLDIL